MEFLSDERRAEILLYVRNDAPVRSVLVLRYGFWGYNQGKFDLFGDTEWHIILGIKLVHMNLSETDKSFFSE